jgi:polyisoprenoid-binding protein YceI
MNRTILTALALSFVCVAPDGFATPTTVVIDPAKSSLKWVGKKVTGSHDGIVSVRNGTATLEGGKLIGGTFDIDMTTISVKDIESPKDNKKLTDHLKSEDFFSASKFPVAKFTITKAEPITGAAGGAPNYQVSGILDVKGITNDVTFPATVTVGDGTATAVGTATLDRTKWNVRYGSGKFFQNLGDRVIYDNFDVALNLVGTVQ